MANQRDQAACKVETMMRKETQTVDLLIKPNILHCIIHFVEKNNPE